MGKYIDFGDGLRYHKDNRLNDLTNKEWLRFQKSWFVLNPKPRKQNLLLHPAKFPEELVEGFIEFFTKEGQLVFDPMAGTGSALVAAVQCNRSAVGIELNETYAEIANKRLKEILTKKTKNDITAQVFCADALEMDDLKIPEVDYCVTSPPYWDMLHAPGFETQKSRKEKGYDVHYSDDSRDAGNIHDYDDFLDFLFDIFEKVHSRLKDNGYLTVIVKNIKKKGKIYPLAWDIARKLDGLYKLKDEKIWCQDNQKLAPYGYKYAWVSNTMHHYCLNFRKEER
jgi:DNA modification methylase